MSRTCLTEGTPYTMPAAPDGARLVLDRGNGRVLTVTADGGTGITVPAGTLERGVYWLAYAPDADTPPVPFATLEVVGLADEYEVRLREELADLDRRIQEGEGHTVTETDGDSQHSTVRIGLTKLRTERAKAESRLSSYLRQRDPRASEGTRWGR